MVNHSNISGSWELRRYVGTKSIGQLADIAYLFQVKYGSDLKIVIVCNCREVDLQIIYERVLSTDLDDITLHVEVVVRSEQVGDLRDKLMDWCKVTDNRKIHWCNDEDEDDIFAVTKCILLPLKVDLPKVSAFRGTRFRAGCGIF